MNLELHLSSSELDEEDLQALTRHLRASIEEETGIPAEIPEGAVVQGARGAEVEAAVILLPILLPLLLKMTTSLTDVLKTSLNRTPSVKIDLVTPDKRKIKLDAKNFDAEALQNLLAQIDRLSR
jgi:hypothetical protein